MYLGTEGHVHMPIVCMLHVVKSSRAAHLLGSCPLAGELPTCSRHAASSAVADERGPSSRRSAERKATVPLLSSAAAMDSEERDMTNASAMTIM